MNRKDGVAPSKRGAAEGADVVYSREQTTHTEVLELKKGKQRTCHARELLHHLLLAFQQCAFLCHLCFLRINRIRNQLLATVAGSVPFRWKMLTGDQNSLPLQAHCDCCEPARYKNFLLQLKVFHIQSVTARG